MPEQGVPTSGYAEPSGHLLGRPASEGMSEERNNLAGANGSLRMRILRGPRERRNSRLCGGGHINDLDSPSNPCTKLAPDPTRQLIHVFTLALMQQSPSQQLFSSALPCVGILGTCRFRLPVAGKRGPWVKSRIAKPVDHRIYFCG